MDDETRTLLIEADSYLSLLWYRYVDKNNIPADLSLEMQNLLARLRTATQ